jgi:hypothetical protein
VLYDKKLLFQCSSSCGEGYKQRRVFCASVSNVTLAVDDMYCDAGVRPHDKERCFHDFCYGTCFMCPFV